MEPDDDAAHRLRAVGSRGQPLPRDAEAAPTSAYAHHPALRVHSFGDGHAAPASQPHHDPARCASFPQQHHRHRHGEPTHAPAASFAAWVVGGGGAGSAPALERAMAEYGGGGALPEFVGAGGGEGVFRVPLRAAAHPGRPPPLELRPHPLREMQVGSFLRALACDPRRRQLWAGAESGVRVWPLDEVFHAWGAGARRDDEDSAPFRESVPAPAVLCVAVDSANGLVWTGHRDGRIRSWRMDHATAAGDGGGNAPMFKEALA
ncbi:hypothetical protein ACP70R_001217 [Stipagrostis hirtigluma subsp. patula]